MTQQLLDEVAAALAGIPEVLEVFGLSGAADLLVRVAARDAADLYRIAGQLPDPLTARSSWCTASSSSRVTRKSPRLSAQPVRA